MFVEFCTSHKDFDMDVLMGALLEAQELCNVIPLRSVVKNDATGEFSVEHGAKVTLFDTTESGLLSLWRAMRKKLHIHCVWLDIGETDYHGCICNWPVYQELCRSKGYCPLRCSEYV